MYPCENHWQKCFASFLSPNSTSKCVKEMAIPFHGIHLTLFRYTAKSSIHDHLEMKSLRFAHNTRLRFSSVVMIRWWRLFFCLQQFWCLCYIALAVVCFLACEVFFSDVWMFCVKESTILVCIVNFWFSLFFSAQYSVWNFRKVKTKEYPFFSLCLFGFLAKMYAQDLSH